MMANREVVNTEVGSYRDSAESEERAQPVDDIQVSTAQVSLQRPGVRQSAPDVFTASARRKGLKVWPDA